MHRIQRARSPLLAASRDCACPRGSSSLRYAFVTGITHVICYVVFRRLNRFSTSQTRFWATFAAATTAGSNAHPAIAKTIHLPRDRPRKAGDNGRSSAQSLVPRGVAAPAFKTSQALDG